MSRLIKSLLFFLALASCQSPAPVFRPDSLGELRPTEGAEFFSSKYEPGSEAYPGLVRFYLKQQLQDGGMDKRLVFRGWDFNSDERIDMLEVLGPDGKAKAVLYDFNFDGLVDHTEILARELE